MKKKINYRIIYRVLAVILALSVMVRISAHIGASGEVCQITETGLTYENLADALDDVISGQTIKLLTNIEYKNNIVVTNKKIVFDLNGMVLNVAPPSGHALEVGAGGEVVLDDSATGGKLNVAGNGSGDKHGVYAHSGAKVEVTNARSGASGTGARGVFADGAGTVVTVYGNIPFDSFYGLTAQNGANVTVYGYVEGGGAMIASGAGTTVTVFGYSSGGGTGVFAYDGALVYIKGNVIGGGAGVYVFNGAQVIVDGYIRATSGDLAYISFEQGKLKKMEGEFEATSSREGYFEYTDGINYVWVKKFYKPVALTIDYMYDATTPYVDQNASQTAATLLINANYGSRLATAPDPEPTKDGYNFIGWFTAANSGNQWVFDKTSGTELSLVNGVDMTARKMTLYAHWEEIKEPEPAQITIDYIYEAGVVYTNQNAANTNASKITNKEYGTMLATAPNPDPTKAGYNFKGWFTEVDGAGIKWIFNASSGTVLSDSNGVDTAASTLRLYAAWEAVEEAPKATMISVKYMFDPHTEYVTQNFKKAKANIVTTVEYGAVIAAAPNPAPTRSGYMFNGWYTEPNGQGVKWVFGETMGTAVTTENEVNAVDNSLTLFANWETSKTAPSTGDAGAAWYLYALLGLSIAGIIATSGKSKKIKKQ